MSTTSIQIALLRREIEQLKSRKEEVFYYQNQADNDKRLIWCADLGSIKNGKYVGTIEIDREIQGINIVPAATDGAVYNAERDGIASFFGTHNAYYQILNYIIAPGYEKWTPQARYGEIFDINNKTNKCSVNISPYSSRFLPYENLDRFENLEQVSIEYPDCNSSAFKEGDIVLVEFEDNNWNLPKVKGFKSNPQSCGEIVFFALGELGILWDITKNTYVVDFEGPQDYADCIAYLDGKTETTMIDPYFGLPYTRLLRTFYTDALYDDYHNKATTWGLPEQSEIPGYLYDKPELSDVVIGPISGLYERRIEWGETVTPWGAIAPAYLNNYFWYDSSSGPIFQPGGVDLSDWSSWDYFDSHFVCPLDIDDAYFSYGTDAEYGNDNIGVGYPGAVMSENSIVQVQFSSHAYTETIGTPGYLETIYTSFRETITACTCGAYPWDDGSGGEETDPQLMAKNDEFSTAVYDLVEALHVLRGVEIMYDSPDYDTEDCPGPDGTTENCNNSLCNYFYNVTNPLMVLKLYRE